MAPNRGAMPLLADTRSERAGHASLRCRNRTKILSCDPSIPAGALGDPAAVADRALTLIGDPEYYGRFFGFAADRTARWRLPGPVERHRLLARGDAVPDVAGTLGPARSGTCARAPGLDARADAA